MTRTKCECGSSILWVSIEGGYLQVEARSVDDGELVVWSENGVLRAAGWRKHHHKSQKRFREHVPHCPTMRFRLGPDYRVRYAF